MILGVGTDIVENARIKKALEEGGDRFLNKVYTAKEVNCCTGTGGLKLPSLAVRFAGKEAVAKALGTGIGRIGWKDIVITKDESGAPVAALAGAARALAKEKGITEVKVSLSHTKEYSVAFVVLT